ncbi:MAG TPA: 50S ribosomal protein L32 [Myxococcota bacterium]|nr:50S ribosomal protein L32 [Myxococcota bacterium]
MSIPKRKKSTSRRDKRRANWKIEPVQTIDCPQCTERMLPHRVCPKCGYYKGREVVPVE